MRSHEGVMLSDGEHLEQIWMKTVAIAKRILSVKNKSSKCYPTLSLCDTVTLAKPIVRDIKSCFPGGFIAKSFCALPGRSKSTQD